MRETSQSFPAAVIFDMDGLMLDTEQMMRPCFQRAAADLGFPVEDDSYATLIGLGTADTFAILAERFGAAFRQPEFEWRFRELANQHPISTLKLHLAFRLRRNGVSP